MKKILKRLYIQCRNRKKNVVLEQGANVSANTRFEGYNRVGEMTIFSGSIGLHSYIGKQSNISAEIGRYCSIAGGVSITNGTHPTRDWVTTCPAIYSPLSETGKSFTNKVLFDDQTPRTKVGNDVWIGSGAIILGGLNISDGAIIAAGAVVTKDVPPYAIVGGVPAKIIRYRFEEKEISDLLALRWWDKPENWIKKHAPDFSDVKLLLSCKENGI